MDKFRMRKRFLAENPGAAAWRPSFGAGLALLLLSGCAGAGSGAPNDEGSPRGEPAKPVTLTFYQYSAFLTDEEFQELIAKPVKSKYPHITLELVRDGKGTSPSELVTAGSMPDIVYTGSAGAVTLIELNAVHDLNGPIKKNGLDPGKFDATAVKFIQSYSKRGETYALPFAINFSALYYNKDLFDKFGVPYPTDGMSWDDAIGLAKKLTRTDNGIPYKGLDLDGGFQRLGEQLALPVIDPKTIRASLQTDGWKTAVDMFKRIKEIPGNADGKAAVPAFEQDRSLAMLAGLGARLGELEELHNKGTPLNWDLAAMPTFREAPTNSFGISLFLLMLSSGGKHKDEAFQVVRLLLGEEVQTALNKRGRQTSLQDPKYRESFAGDLKSAQGKNVAAIYKRTPALLPPLTKYDNIAKSELAKAAAKVAAGGSDVNTALREAEDQANKLIAAEAAK
ncbi:ABC transporter substrate-binding protein [Paenibacillus sp. GYB003]|uniref:ABC transporter substrate-binding protein n=1 Tax=Paenibacillus sp. GYB003 TaxID=2994392 RepID=UPI002F96D31D